MFRAINSCSGTTGVFRVSGAGSENILSTISQIKGFDHGQVHKTEKCSSFQVVKPHRHDQVKPHVWNTMLVHLKDRRRKRIINRAHGHLFQHKSYLQFRNEHRRLLLPLLIIRPITIPLVVLRLTHRNPTHFEQQKRHERRTDPTRRQRNSLPK